MKNGERFFWGVLLVFVIFAIICGIEGYPVAALCLMIAVMGAIVGSMYFPKYYRNSKSTKRADLMVIGIKTKVKVMEYGKNNVVDRVVTIDPGLYFLERRLDHIHGSEDILFITGTTRAMPESFWRKTGEMKELR